MSTPTKQSPKKNSNQNRQARKATPQPASTTRIAPNGNGAASTNGAAQPATTYTSPAAENAAKAAAARQARRDADLAARQERRAQAQAAAQRRQMMRNLIAGAIGVLVLAGIVVSYMAYQDAHPGESFTDQGNTHIILGAEHPAYNSTPPTSGWHTNELAPWGIRTETPPVEQLVHNLEDGGVVIYYRPDIDAATLDQLESLVTSYGGAHLVLTPYDQISDPIVATAWTKMQKFSGFDANALRKFIDAYEGIDHHVAGIG